MHCQKLNTYMETGRVVFLPFSAITPNPNQPRTEFSEHALEELAQSLPGGNSTEEIADGHALTQAIGEFLKQVSDTARTAFICRYFYMDSLRETARTCGITESNAKVLLHRTRQGLREYLEKEGYL